jgi:MoxR-like ATPase
LSSTSRQALPIAIDAGVPVLLWGGPGTGKTSALLQLAADAALPCEVVIASIREPSDFAGLPVIQGDGGSVVMAPPRWAQRLAAAGRGVLLLDELSTAPPAVQAALLRVVLERAVGDLQLPDGVVIVAAANPADEAAHGWNLAAPLANRFCHLDWTADASEWADGLVGGFPRLALPETHADELASHVLRARAEVAAFVRQRTALLYRLPSSQTEAGRAWPSPRSWTMAATLLGTAEAAGASPEVAALLVSGCVGPVAAAELFGWRDQGALPDPEAVLRDPASLVLPERTDRAYAVLTSIVGAVAANPTSQRWESAWRAIVHGAHSDSPDIVIPAARQLIGLRPDGAVPPADVLAVIAPLLREAGMLDAFAPHG